MGNGQAPSERMQEGYMPYSDMPRADLERYRPELTIPSNFDAFWAETLAQRSTVPLAVQVTRREYPVDGVGVFDVRFDGADGTRLAAWLLLPDGAESAPGLVFYHGYGWYKEEVYTYLTWALQGYAVLALDTRGQSGDSSEGPHAGGHMKGWMTAGI